MKKVTIKNVTREIRVDGKPFAGAHLGETILKCRDGINFNHFQNTMYEAKASKHRFYLTMTDRNKFGTSYLFFKTLKDVRTFIQANF